MFTMQVLFPRQREKYSFSGAQSAMSSNPTFSLKKSPCFQKTLITRRKFVVFTQFVFSPVIDADLHSQNTCNLLGNTFFLDSNFFFLVFLLSHSHPFLNTTNHHISHHNHISTYYLLTIYKNLLSSIMKHPFHT